MKFRQSHSHPQLEVSEAGMVRFIETKEVLTATHNHSMRINGPLVYFRTEGKTKQLSLRQIVYETWVKEAKICKGEFVVVKNDDENDCRASNLERFKRKSERRDKDEIDPGKYSCWLNSHDEVYLW